jgi:glycosyltransferase involved in cell wall biosynthesis
MEISIALATYNGERFLQAQLDSLRSQTLPPCEVIASDDCSSDRTLAMLDRFAGEAPFPVRVEQNAHRLGLGDNFLKAAAACRGEAVAFCDQDDEWHDQKLERAAIALSRPEALLVLHAGLVADGRGRSTGRRHPAIKRDRLLGPREGSPWEIAPGFAMVFRSRLLRLADPAARPWSRFTAGPMHHDEWMWFLAWVSGGIQLLATPLVRYRQHGGNTAGVPPRGLWRDMRGAARTDASTYRERAELSQSYSEFLHRLDWPEAEAAAVSFAVHAARLRRRAKLYEQRQVGARLSAFSGLLRDCAYAPDAPAGLGRRAAVKDAIYAFAGRARGVDEA